MTSEKLAAAVARSGAGLCVGLDPDPARLPAGLDVLAFNLAIIEATRDLVAAYKPNMAFYEALGGRGWEVLRKTLAAIPGDVPVILDAKRGDIGNTARMYAAALYDELGGDAVTLSPYMGREALQPFVDRADKLAFVLAATSNPGAAELQDLRDAGGVPLYLKVTRLARELHEKPGAVGLVAGATRPEVLAEIRAAAPAQWLLVPGVGAQGGDLGASLAHGAGRMLINVSREVLYASSGADFADAARRAAMEVRDAIVRSCA